MKKIVRLALLAICLLPLISSGQESLAVRNLREMVEQEEEIFRSAQRPDGGFDQRTLEGKFQGLIHRYDAFIQTNPEFSPGYVAYARMLERIGKRDAARVMYMKANELDPNIPLVKNQLGNYLAEEGDFAQALPYYLAATELAPDEALYHYQLGKLLYECRDGFLEKQIFTRTVLDEKMLDAFQEAAKLAPDEMVFAYRFAEAYYDLEKPRWDEALEAWNAVEKLATTDIERQTVHLHRANIALKRGQPKTARELLKKVEAPILLSNKAQLEKQLAPKP